jgi:tol-pal system-associated acyl-CoA thioesterase
VKTKVYYADTDAGGVVYYANYLRWMEMARADWLELLGMPLASFVEQGVLFAVVRAEIDYHQPAVLGDEVEVTVRPAGVRRVRFAVDQQVVRVRDRATLASAHISVACLTPEGRPTAVPAALSEALGRGLPAAASLTDPA